jgi:glycosyltransferase involved in cell wall biosynthesis
MISVLVPVYNTHISELVSALHKQILTLSYPGEIIVLDDGSDIKYKLENRAVLQLSNVTYNELLRMPGISGLFLLIVIVASWLVIF